MRLDRLGDLTHRKGPFATLSIDPMVDGEPGRRGVDMRLQAHVKRLSDLGAPRRVVSAVEEAVSTPTGRGGHIGRLVVADGDGVALDLVLPQRPVLEEAVWGAVPYLLPAVRAFSKSTSYLLAEVDSSGADLQVVDARGDGHEASTVEGGHDVLHKVHGGGPSHRRFQTRVEDSIERNAGAVAEALATEVKRYGSEVLLLAGIDKPVSAVLEQLPPSVAERAIRLKSGGRAAGTDHKSRDREVSEVLEARDRKRRAAVLDRFAGAQGRQREAVQGLESIVDVLQRGQVEELLLHDNPASDLTLWTTGRPEQLAIRRADIESMGGGKAERVRADAAIVWALAGSGASITLLDDEDLRLVDGVGALLRWADSSTPHDGVPSMPGHGKRRRHTGP